MVRPDPGDFRGVLALRDEELAPWPRTTEVVRNHLADYHAAVEFLDARVCRGLGDCRPFGA